VELHALAKLEHDGLVAVPELPLGREQPVGLRLLVDEDEGLEHVAVPEDVARPAGEVGVRERLGRDGRDERAARLGRGRRAAGLSGLVDRRTAARHAEDTQRGKAEEGATRDL
jgi:hypothetical protein